MFNYTLPRNIIIKFTTYYFCMGINLTFLNHVMLQVRKNIPHSTILLYEHSHIQEFCWNIQHGGKVKWHLCYSYQLPISFYLTKFLSVTCQNLDDRLIILATLHVTCSVKLLLAMQILYVYILVYRFRKHHKKNRFLPQHSFCFFFFQTFT